MVRQTSLEILRHFHDIEKLDWKTLCGMTNKFTKYVRMKERYKNELKRWNKIITQEKECNMVTINMEKDFSIIIYF